MANKDSAKKAMRSSARQQVFNLRRKKAMKAIVKSTRELIAGGDKKSAEGQLPQLYKAVDKAVKCGILKKNTAARKKSRLTHAVEKI